MSGLELDHKVAYSSPARMLLAHFILIHMKSSKPIQTSRRPNTDMCVLFLKSLFIVNTNLACFGVFILSVYGSTLRMNNNSQLKPIFFLWNILLAQNSYLYCHVRSSVLVPLNDFIVLFEIT